MFSLSMHSIFLNLIVTITLFIPYILLDNLKLSMVILSYMTLVYATGCVSLRWYTDLDWKLYRKEPL